MMYIRTKDGVYKVSHLNAYATHKRKGETLLEGYKTSYIKNENIITKSENLEELCDEFVVEIIKLNFKYVWNERLNSKMEELKKNANKVCNVYGAIWTDKGLIYVAKMNEKGELELL